MSAATAGPCSSPFLPPLLLLLPLLVLPLLVLPLHSK
jgi:hypothetical protein